MSSNPASKPDLSSNTPDIPTGLPTKPFNEEQWLLTNPFREQMPSELSKRAGKFGKLGKKATIEVNSHAILTWPDKSVYQYDVSQDPLTL
jgi:hypothetical protein